MSRIHAQPDWMPAVAGYEVHRLIASGSQAKVYLARNTTLDRLEAIKVLVGEVARRSVESRFQSEARILAANDHPHIVRIYSAGRTDDGDPYIAMEYMRGGSAAAYVPSPQPITSERVARIGSDVSSALAWLHDKNILHRDIKPANVLLDEHGQAKLGDLGLSKELLVSDNSDDLGGTLAYAAPERLLGQPSSIASDIYSLGATLWALALGRVPVLVGADSALETVPDPLATVIRKAMATEPSERFGSAKDLSQALDDAGEAIGGGHELTTSWVGFPDEPTRTLAGDKIGTAADAIGPVHPTDGAGGRERRRAMGRVLENRALWAAAAAIAVTGVLLTSLYLAGVREPEPLVSVPRVSGDLKNGRIILETRGLEVLTVGLPERGYPNDASEALYTDPPAETRVERGSRVVLYFKRSDLGGTWGPPRQTQSCKDGCVGLPFPTFNSLVDTPIYGDEKNFVTARLATTESEVAAAPYENEVAVSPGDEIDLRIWINNGGNEPGGDDGYRNRATGVRVGLDATNLGSYLQGAMGIIGWINAENTDPLEVFDSVRLRSTVPTSLRYVRGSAVLHRVGNGELAGDAALKERVSDEIMSEDGVEVHSNSADAGEWWASYSQLGFITVRFEVLGIPNE